MFSEELLLRANSGDVDACNEVGDCYHDGNGVSQDFERAVYYVNSAKKLH